MRVLQGVHGSKMCVAVAGAVRVAGAAAIPITLVNDVIPGIHII